MADTAIETVNPHTALARPDDTGLSIETIVGRVEKIKQVQARVMREGHHYGKIPGVDRPTLLQPGAQMLCMTFQLAPTFELDERRDGDHLEVTARCMLTHAPTGTVVGGGVGSCSTRESRYAYRRGERVCPECGSGALRKSKNDPEWFCWRKLDGCGATFDIDDERITSQVVDRVDNPDLPDVYNTVRKMATKRALVAATLIATCASDLFTQDVEDDAPKEQGRKPTARGGADGDLFVTIAAAIAKARTPNELAAVARQLQDVREQRSLPPEPYKRLRAAWTAKRDELERGDECVDAEYEDVERGAIAGEAS